MRQAEELRIVRDVHGVRDEEEPWVFVWPPPEHLPVETWPVQSDLQIRDHEVVSVLCEASPVTSTS